MKGGGETEREMKQQEGEEDGFRDSLISSPPSFISFLPHLLVSFSDMANIFLLIMLYRSRSISVSTKKPDVEKIGMIHSPFNCLLPLKGISPSRASQALRLTGVRGFSNVLPCPGSSGNKLEMPGFST